MVNWKEIHPNFTEELQKEWEDRGFSYLETKEWIVIVGLKPIDSNFAKWLNIVKKKDFKWVFEYGDEQELRKEYKRYLGNKINAQEWLDKNYPEGECINSAGKKVKRSEVREIYFNEPSLEGKIDLKDFSYKLGVKVYIHPSVDKTKLIFINKSEKAKVIEKAIHSYEDLKNLTKEEKVRTKVINIRNKNLEGELDLSEFINLEELNCWSNKLTKLNLSNCKELKRINCNNNQLISINYPLNPETLIYLDIDNNNLSGDLSIFSQFINLKRLWIGNWEIGNNKFTGSLDPLQNLTKLENLDISNTDINEVNIDKLPNSLETIRYFLSYKRSDCKLTKIVPLLDKYFGKFGRCKKCWLANTSRDWCQPCAEKEWKQFSGQELVEKFIEQQGKYSDGEDKFPLIPYEQFTNIEYLATGGFSRIDKAYWGKGTTKKWNKEKLETVIGIDVVLKTLTNSNNITLEFLQEIANTKLVWQGGVVPCYGISQNPETKNYVMVMKYIKEGNLRDYLKNNIKKLSWKDKLDKLRPIVMGLYHIHEQNLVHRDFHSGNILNNLNNYKTYITDLGLSSPVNHQKKTGQIFGVLPYVAPEVLRGQPYTKTSDIYSFGIIAYEICSGLPPYYDREHNVDLALAVCQGLRPQSQIKIPRLLEDLINRCWNSDPKQRPSAEKLWKILNDWYGEISKNKENASFTQQAKEADEYNQSLSEEVRFPKYEIHKGAVYHSKAINTKQITGLLKNKQFGTKDLDFSLDMIEELKELEINDNQDWLNINPNFTEELINQWQNLNFTYQQTQDWINMGLQITDYNFVAWLRDTKQLTTEQVLNQGNLEQLNQEFFTWLQEQQSAQIQIPPK